jgi:hypothetical protein
MKSIALYQSRIPLIAHEYKIYNLSMDKIDMTTSIQELNTYDIVLIGLYRNQDIILSIDSQVKIILVVDDIWSIRNRGKLSLKDRCCIDKAKAFIYLSQYFITHIPSRGKPRMVLPLKPNEHDLHFIPLPKIPHSIVYSGKYLKSKWEDRKSRGGYRAYHEIFSKLIGMNWNVYIVTNTEDMKEYEDIGCNVIRNIPQNQIYKYLSQFELGFHGFNYNGIPELSKSYINQCTPNKTWEYLASGIPTLSYNAGLSSLILDKKWGYAVNSLSEIDSLDWSKLPLDYYRGMEIIDNYKNKVWELITCIK